MDYQNHNFEKKRKLSQELEHITKEMYKKNLELLERNKTLALLHQIDEVILGSVTNVEQIADQVANAIVSQAGRIVFIYLKDEKENFLRPLAVSARQELEEIDYNLQRAIYTMKISLEEKDNPLVISLNTKKNYTVNHLHQILKSHLSKEACDQIQMKLEVAFFDILPLIVRQKSIGVLVLGLGSKENFFQYKNSLIDELPGIIGIAVNNALLYKKIQEINNKLRELDILKDEFVSVASHELRTPMTAIKSYLWMALAGKGGKLSEKQKYYLERAYKSTDRLIKLVNDMLNISRIESGRMIFDFQRINLIRLVKEVLEEIEPRANEIKINIQLQFEKSAERAFVLADSDKIREVLINLLGNSLKFTPAGGRITISIKKKDSLIETAISDTGCGIESEDLPKLFQKFGVIHGSYTINQSVPQGTGLGLYICRSIIEKHGGQIWAESKGKGKGTTFIFTLKTA